MKKTLILPAIFLLTSFTFIKKSLSQVDPTSALLVNPSTRTNDGAPATSSSTTSSGLDSGRYTVKSSAPAPATSKSITTSPTSAEIKRGIQDKAVEIKEKNTKHTSKARADKNSEAVASEEKDLSDEVKTAFVGGEEEITKFKSQLDSEDTRRNLLDLSIAPGLIYVDSSSAYWFRNYSSSGPGVSVAADIWVSPFFGVDLDYFTSLSASITSEPTTDKTILVDHRFTSAGFQFRKFSNASRMSSSFNAGLRYTEYQMIIPAGEENRVKIKSAGVALALMGTVPTDISRKISFGVELMPKLRVTEVGAGVKSGSGVNSYAIRFLLGQEFIIDHSNRVFWQLSYRHDQTVYKGTAKVADPITATKPEGVSVRSGMTLFQLGYTWGD